jgi:replicative DNA helicase
MREMPWSDEAEKGVLSATLADPTNFVTVIEILSGDEFIGTAHAKLFQAMRDVYASGDTIDVITVAERLKTLGTLDDVGGYPFLGELIDYAPHGDNVHSYVKTVQNKYLARKLIEAARDIQEAAYVDGGSDINTLLGEAERRVFDVSQSSRIEGATNIGDVLWGLFNEFDARMRGDHMPGLPTGFVSMDKMTSGLRKGQLIIIAGRPSMGKTAMALNIAANAAISHARAVAIFSMEMSKEELAERLVSAESRVDSQKLRTGNLEDIDFKHMAEAAGYLKDAKIIVDDTPALRPMELRAKARRVKAEHDVDLVIVDYLQLMDSDTKTNNRVQEISEISRALKTMAKELGVPVVALSQLSRKVEERSPPRPILSDLRDSGSIEQDADVVVLIYRPEFYFGASREGKDIRGEAEIIVAKQRNGPTGMLRLHWNAPITRFE